MDSGNGHFEMTDKLDELEALIEEHPNHGGVFSIGDKVELRGSKFRVCKITPKKLVLRLQPKN